MGQPVNFTVDAYPLRAFAGKVSQVRYGSITNQNVINYDCVIAVSNPDGKLLPGMTANVSIVIAERTNVVKIPNGALRFRPPEGARQDQRSPANRPPRAARLRPGESAGRAAGLAPPCRADRARTGPCLNGRSMRTVYVLPDKPESNGKDSCQARSRSRSRWASMMAS